MYPTIADWTAASSEIGPTDVEMRSPVGFSRIQFAVPLTVAPGSDQNCSNSATGPQGQPVYELNVATLASAGTAPDGSAAASSHARACARASGSVLPMMAIAAVSLGGEGGDDGCVSAGAALPAPASGVAQLVRASASTDVSRNAERGRMWPTVVGRGSG